MASPFVLIVGGGPSGLLLAIMLGRKSIPVVLLEAENQLDSRPRATHYGAPAVRELQRAGVYESMREKGGFFPSGVCWRLLHGDILATIHGPKGDEKHPLICLPLNRLNEVLQEHLAQLPSVELRLGAKVVALEQDDKKARVTIETAQGSQTLEADYVVGCDGANSFVRRTLFGDLNFPGFTWEEQLVATNIYYPFEKHGYDIDSSFIIHREHWHMAAKISTDGMWRVTYGEVPGLTTEQLRERLPEKFKQILPGAPGPDAYEIANFSPYKVHQRLAPSMRVGRVLLAADAAHLCNPFGGLGLTGGIVDVGGLFDCLYGIHSGRANQEILDIYDRVRREKYNDVINPVSSSNIRRLFDQDPETAMQNDDFLKMVKRAESDAGTAEALQEGAFAVQYDFTQHYHLPN